MALSILNNIPSLAAQNQLSISGASLQKTLFRLSSGSRINSGADDAAGLAIADGLHANVTALTQSARNATDGIGMLQVADGSLGQITALNAEYTQIQDQIDKIGGKTTYNGSAIFGRTSATIFMSDGSGAANATSLDISDALGAVDSNGLGLTAAGLTTST